MASPSKTKTPSAPDPAAMTFEAAVGELEATVAKIEEVGDRGEAVVPLVALGEQRVRIFELDRSLPYLAGEVDPIDEPTSQHVAPELLERARTATTRYARAMLMHVRGEWRANPDIPSDPAELGYKMGSLLVDRPATAQRVLEATSLDERLKEAIPGVEDTAAAFEAAVMEKGTQDHRRGMQRN